MFDAELTVEQQEKLIPRLAQGEMVMPLHRAWVQAGSIVTPEALERVIQVFRQDSIPGARSDGSGRFRASMFGDKCDRKQMLSYYGAPTAERDVAFHEMVTNGTFNHYRWQLSGLSAGWLVDIEVKVAGVGAMDGLLVGAETGWELKTTNYNVIKKVVESGPSEAHLDQMHRYMMEADLGSFVIMYQERNFLDVKELFVERDESRIVRIKDKLDRLGEYARAGSLPPMLDECMTGSGKTFSYCQYAGECVKRPAK